MMGDVQTSPGFEYTDLPLVGRRDNENGLVYFGTIVSGVFVKLAVRKLAGLDADIATAAAVASGSWKPPTNLDGTESNTTLPHIVLPPPAPVEQPAPPPGPDAPPTPAA